MSMFTDFYRSATVAFAKACREKLSVAEFHLVTSQGANRDSMFLCCPSSTFHQHFALQPFCHDIFSFQPTLSYMRTKGEVEHAVISLKFPLCYIYRPGLLDRGDSKRMVEKLGLFFLPST
jgi:hypothetical protein